MLLSPSFLTRWFHNKKLRNIRPLRHHVTWTSCHSSPRRHDRLCTSTWTLSYVHHLLHKSVVTLMSLHSEYDVSCDVLTILQWVNARKSFHIPAARRQHDKSSEFFIHTVSIILLSLCGWLRTLCFILLKQQNPTQHQERHQVVIKDDDITYQTDIYRVRTWCAPLSSSRRSFANVINHILSEYSVVPLDHSFVTVYIWMASFSYK